jgi:hypothetical protein
MYPKFFFERFWKGDQKNELFVCMPFHDSFDKKFKKTIIPCAKKVGLNSAERVKENWEADSITDRIFDGIANSKLLLFDLSDDPKSPCQHSRHVNGNVLYELGIAMAIREPEDIILMKERSTTVIPFDISGININFYDGELKNSWLTKVLEKSLTDQSWYKSKRVDAAAKSIDDIGLYIMCNIGCRPKGQNHFNTNGWKIEDKVSVLRLVDLGILMFASKIHSHGAEHAYHWTPFGYEVMKHIGVKFMTDNENNNVY